MRAARAGPAMEESSVRIVKVAIVGLLVVVLVAVVAGAGGLAWVTTRAHAQSSGTVREDGLSAEARVDRDANGIAHITAATPADLVFTQGWVHASERMWQMEVWRHISAGRLSEMFGPSQLDTDKFIRALGWRRAAERDLPMLSEEARAVLDAYAAGVNAWLDGHRGSLGLAFLVTGTDPEPWTPLDSLAWGKVQAWNLGGNLDSEIFRYLADAKLGGAERTDELFPVREGSPVITPTEQDLGQVTRDRTATDARAPTASLTDAQAAGWRGVVAAAANALAVGGLDGGAGLASDHGIGSNDWVAAPELSSTGGALLANDPHLGISAPSIWYINGLHCTTVSDACPYEVAGVSFPGVPGVVLGHNARIAWGATNVDPDVQDLVIETPDPADPTRYIGPDGTSQPYQMRTEEIAVNGADPVMLDVRETVHGPILNDVDERLTDAPLMALRWSSTLPDAAPDRTVEGILGLNTASDYDDFRASLSNYLAPSQNFVYADVDGHIGYQLPGYIPVRSDPDDRGLRPVRGDGSSEWTGRIPYESLPHQLDPQDGWIVTANNAAVDDQWPDFIGAEWDPGYRAERIIDLLNGYAQDGMTIEEMGEIQNDTAPLRARDIAIRLGEGQPATGDGATIAARIAEWDGTCTIASLGCAAYMAWEYRVLRGLFDDDLGDLARDYVGSAPSWVALERLLDDPESPWWDDTTTADGVETAAEVVLAAMDDAGAELRTAFGEPGSWTWGRLHTATFREQTIGDSGIGPLESYVNAGPVEVPGAAGAVNNMYYRLSRAYPDPLDPDFVPLGIDGIFTVTNMPSMRFLIDMSDLDGARIVAPPGQSGNPFDGHYSDQIVPWRDGTTLSLPFTREAIDAATVSTLTLTP